MAQMTAIDDSRLHEWAEFNLPTELLGRPAVLSPLARRVLAASGVPPDGREPADAAARRRMLPNLGVLLLPRIGLTSPPKP